jgi:hypothetical protein
MNVRVKGAAWFSHPDWLYSYSYSGRTASNGDRSIGFRLIKLNHV